MPSKNAEAHNAAEGKGRVSTESLQGGATTDGILRSDGYEKSSVYQQKGRGRNRALGRSVEESRG